MGERSFVTRCNGVLVAFGIVLIAATAMPSAQRRRADNANEGMPVATNRILQSPETYFGKRVTVSAGVEQVVSTTAFLVDQRRSTVRRTSVPSASRSW
jgi:hypothetical protein